MKRALLNSDRVRILLILVLLGLTVFQNLMLSDSIRTLKRLTAALDACRGVPPPHFARFERSQP